MAQLDPRTPLSSSAAQHFIPAGTYLLPHHRPRHVLPLTAHVQRTNRQRRRRLRRRLHPWFHPSPSIHHPAPSQAAPATASGRQGQRTRPRKPPARARNRAEWHPLSLLFELARGEHRHGAQRGRSNRRPTHSGRSARRNPVRGCSRYPLVLIRAFLTVPAGLPVSILSTSQ
jgi:hypothetical protein